MVLEWFESALFWMKTTRFARSVGRIRPLAEYEKEKGCEEVLRCLPSDPVTGNGTSEVIQIEGKDKRWFELDAVFE